MTGVFEKLKVPGAKIETAECRQWRATHSNCIGCSSEKACQESVARYMQYVTMKVEMEGGVKVFGDDTILGERNEWRNKNEKRV